MDSKVLIVLVNKYSFESSIKFIEELENNFDDNFSLFYINNGGFFEKNNELKFGEFLKLKEYVFIPETLNESVVLDKITHKIKRFETDYLYFVFDDFEKTLSYLPVLTTLSKVDDVDAVGIRGGSVFSAFLYNVSFFQKNTSTEWLDFNGMLLSSKAWGKNKIDLRYYRDFYQVDFGYKLKKSEMKMFKLRPYEYKKDEGMINYFRIRNPFLFLAFNYPFGKYFIGFLYFLFQLPYSVFRLFVEKFSFSGLMDGFKLLFSSSPEIHHHRKID